MAIKNLLPQRWATVREGREVTLPAQKRIQTPAGARLSDVLNTDVHLPSPMTPKSPLTLAKSAGAVIVTREVDVESFRQSQAQRSTLGNIQSSLSTSLLDTRSLFSEKSVFASDDGEKPKGLWRKGGFSFPLAMSMNIANFKRRRILWITAFGMLVILALVIGLAVGLTRKSHHSNKSISPVANTSGGGGITTTSPASPTATSAVSHPANFPVGVWSVFTFLDTILTNCTSNSVTWICPPGPTYQQNPTASLATFNFEVKNGSTSGSYTIGPTTTGPQNSIMSDWSFTETQLELVNSGQSSESYRFQLQLNKRDFVPSMALSDHTAGPATCFFNSTTFQGYLFTKMARTYPANDQSLPVGANDAWPYAAKMEEVVGGGQNMPNCWTQDPGGMLGSNVTVDLFAMPAGDLCSCLYINYDT